MSCGSLRDTHLAPSDSSKLLTGADKSPRGRGNHPCVWKSWPWLICHPMNDSIRYLEGETLGKGFWLRSSRPKTWQGTWEAGSQRTPGASRLHRRGRGRGAGAAPQGCRSGAAALSGCRLPPARAARGSPQPRLPAAAPFKPPTYSGLGCTTGSRHEFVLFCCFCGHGRRLGAEAAGSDGVAATRKLAARSPPPPGPPLVNCLGARGTRA